MAYSHRAVAAAIADSCRLARLRRVEQAVQGLPSEKRAALEARPPGTVQYASAERARKRAAPNTMNPMVMGPMMANSGGLDFLDDFLGLFDTECEQRQRPHARAHRRAAADGSVRRPTARALPARHRRVLLLLSRADHLLSHPHRVVCADTLVHEGHLDLLAARAGAATTTAAARFAAATHPPRIEQVASGIFLVEPRPSHWLATFGQVRHFLWRASGGELRRRLRRWWRWRKKYAMKTKLNV